jgi:hypothetical protein
MNGLPAKKTPNVSQQFKIATKNAEQEPLAGLSALVQRGTSPLSTWPNVLKKTTALAKLISFHSMGQRSASNSTAKLKSKPVPMIDAAFKFLIYVIANVTLASVAGINALPEAETKTPLIILSA